MKLPTKAAIVALLGDVAFILTILASLSYQLGDIAEFFPPAIKAAATGIGIFATLGLKIAQRLMERLQGNRDAHGIDTAITVAKEAAGVPPIAVPRCDKAPAGWVCTRERGHEGLCSMIRGYRGISVL